MSCGYSSFESCLVLIEKRFPSFSGAGLRLSPFYTEYREQAPQSSSKDEKDDDKNEDDFWRNRFSGMQKSK